MMKNALIIVAMMLLSVSSLAFTDNKWQADASGNWNGKWSDVAHWSKGRLPNLSEDDNAIFDNQDVSYTVEIDGDYVVPGYLKIGDSNPKKGNGMIAFSGSGTVRQNQGTLYVYNAREVYVGGEVTIGEVGALYILDGGKVNVTGGGSILVSGDVTISEATEIHIRDNGRLHGALKVVNACTEGFFSMSGGLLKCPKSLPVFPESFEIEVTGGRLCIVGDCLDSRFLPKDGAVFEQIGNGYGTFLTAVPFTNELSGTYIGTNSSETSGFRFDAFTSIYGGGELFTDAYIPNSTGIVDVSRLGIGTRFYPQSYSFVSYPADMTISAYGDYSNPGTYDSAKAGISQFAGQVVFDTCNAFNRTTRHSTVFTGLSETPGFGFRVTGGGEHTMYLKGIEPRMPAIRNVSVDSDTALVIHESSVAKEIRADALELGLNSSLDYRASRNTIDAVDTHVEANASVTVNMNGLSASDSNGTRVRPIFMTTTGEVPELSKFTFNNLSGWEVKNVDGVIYAKSNTPEANTNPSRWRWTGLKGSDWSEGGNWAGNEDSVPGTDDVVYFNLVDGENIINIPSEGVEVKRVIGGGRNDEESKWYRNAEPFGFQGGDLKISGTGSGDYSSGIFTCSQCPLLFDCKVVGTGTTLGVLGYSYIGFRGGIKANELKIVSEVRVGGNSTVQKLTSAADNYTDSSRYTTLTVLKGGYIETIQDSSNRKHLGLRILGGGTASFAGTFSYDSATLPTSYQVDGRLNFTGALKLNVPVMITGTGRVDVASNVSDSGDGRITMKGGITLSPECWNTASASGFGTMPLSVAAAQSATLAPRGDVIYGPAVGAVPMTAAAERSFRLGCRATLVIATDDIDNPSVSHDVTFVDPVEAEPMAQMVKTGGGKMTLSSSSNMFADKAGVDVREGTLAWTAAQSLGSLKMSSGTLLEFTSTNDAIPALTVGSDVDLDGVGLVLAKGSRLNGLDYHTVVVVSEGRSICGKPVPVGNIKLRLANVDGRAVVQVRKVYGTRIVIQ